jgi:hypothetical protein
VKKKAKKAPEDSPVASAGSNGSMGPCFNCGRACAPGEYCFGCKRHVCDECAINLEIPFGAHTPEMHLEDAP